MLFSDDDEDDELRVLPEPPADDVMTSLSCAPDATALTLRLDDVTESVRTNDDDDAASLSTVVDDDDGIVTITSRLLAASPLTFADGVLLSFLSSTATDATSTMTSSLCPANSSCDIELTVEPLLQVLLTSGR